MAEMKLKEEQELWEPAEVNNGVVRELKEKPDCGGVQSHRVAGPTSVQIKEESKEVKIPQEASSECPFKRIIVKSENEEEEFVHEAVKEENEEDRGGADRQKHSESSSDTDDSGDWTLAESPTDQTHTVLTDQLQEPHHGNVINEAGGPDKQHKCSHCGKEFANSSTLRIHAQSHTGQRPFRCSICSKSFITNHRLTAHMRFHTGERPFKCSVCAMTFSQTAHLKTHMWTHTGERPFRCAACAKGFAARISLKKHMKMHPSERPFRCVVSHTGQKQFRCNICAQEFSARSALYRHKVSHKERLRYKCTVCARGYVRKGARDRHEKTHKEPTTSVSSFSCSVCKTQFQQSVPPENHMTDGRLIKNEMCSKCLLNKFCPIRPKPAQSQSNPPQVLPSLGPVQSRVGRKRTRGHPCHRRLLTIAPGPKGIETYRLFVLESKLSNNSPQFPRPLGS